MKHWIIMPKLNYRWLLGIILSVVLIFSSLLALEPLKVGATGSPTLRITGFFSTDPFNQINNVQYSEITDLIWLGCCVTSSSNPTLEGDFGMLSTLRTKTTASGTKLLASVQSMTWGTAQTPSNLTVVLENSSLMATLVTNMVNMVSKYSLDGLCIDWEGTDVTEPVYHTFLTKLREALPSPKLIAVCGNANPNYFPWFNATTDSPLIDMFEIMTYGIADPVLCTQSDFQTYANMWVSDGFPASKLDLGIPVYSADADGLLGSYGQVISEFNPAVSLNQISTPTANGFTGNNLTVNGGVLGWNCVDLALTKTQWAAANNIGGIMLFAVDYDAVGNPESLLITVYDELHTTTPVALSITTSTLPHGTVGVAYSQTLIATGGTPSYTWTVASGSLPAGLSLTSGGVISGKPTTACSSVSMKFRVTDNTGAKSTQVLTLGVSTAPVGRHRNP